eukprot:11595963-Ditylum_brightwellii.AAC.1
MEVKKESVGIHSKCHLDRKCCWVRGGVLNAHLGRTVFPIDTKYCVCIYMAQKLKIIKIPHKRRSHYEKIQSLQAEADGRRKTLQ